MATGMTRWDFIDALPAARISTIACWVAVKVLDSPGPAAYRPAAWAASIGVRTRVIRRAMGTLLERRILLYDESGLLRVNPEPSLWSPTGRRIG